MASHHKKKSHNRRLTRYGIMEHFGMTEEEVDKYMPEGAKIRKMVRGKPRIMWNEKTVVSTIKGNPELQKKLERRQQIRAEREAKFRGAVDFLTQFSPDILFDEGKLYKRKFYLHVGPTNSGKTYQALQALRKASSGVYLGPLRLLALEVCETLNYDGIPCDLLTGEEAIEVPGANITASTIELCDYQKHYEVAVIDEAQMLSDPSRGAKWVRAISLIDADNVYICLAPEALTIIENIMKKMEAEYEVVRHERLVPLKFGGEFQGISDVEPGDALITFSRKKVLEIAAQFEKAGIQASVIYGALPPASRREEVRRFSQGETKIVVATDAIGMGVSLPIRRVIFTETEKYDGKRTRPLSYTEIKQIAGRAGRFGKYDLGYALSMTDAKRIERALQEPAETVERLTIAFPSEALDYDYPLLDMLETWNALPRNEIFSREDMTDPILLLKNLKNVPAKTDRKLIFNLITCPVDTGSDELVGYWAECAMEIIRGRQVERPYFYEETLADCELQYHAYDIYHQLLRRIGIEDDCLEEKARLIEKINEFLKEDKKNFLKRCRICGKEMGIRERYSICDRCRKKGYGKFW